jgi:DnaJ-class molecular chaperone
MRGKEMDLIKVLDQIKSDIHKLEREYEDESTKLKVKYDTKIKDLKTALQVNMELNTTCLECKGRGSVAVLDAAGDTEHEICSRCNGTGKEPKF